MKKRFLLFIFVLSLTLGGHAATLTLEQCIDTALVNSLSLRTQRNSYEQARLQYTQSKSSLAPSIQGSVGQNWSFGRSTGADNVIVSRNASSTSFDLSAGITLFDGLGMKFRIDEAKASMQSSAAALEEYEMQLRLTVASMYLQVLLNKQLLQVAEEQLEKTSLTLQRDSALIAAHRMAEGEIYAIRAQAAQEQLNVLQAKNTLQLSLLDLAQAIDLVDFESFDIVVPSDEQLITGLLPDKESVYQNAIQNWPSIRKLQYSISANEAAVKGAKAAYSPTISAYASVGSNYYKMKGVENESFATQMSDNLTEGVGLTMQIPIFDRLQTPLAVRQRKMALENAQLQLEQEKKALRKDIDQAYYNAANAYVEQQSAEHSAQSFEEALRYAEQKLEAGRGTSYEYTSAKTDYLRAVSSALQAKYNYLFRLRILDYYQGTWQTASE
ncbi:MAG: TolC family protein [Paludibacteraceae bacterium]|nr:TolC family protein [Paludibacteraceae bacterium]